MKNSVRKNQDFQDIFNQKKFIKNDFFTIYYAKSSNNEFQFGIVTGKKKFKFAYTRNRVKRWVREVIIKNKIILEAIPYRVIIIVNVNIYNIEFQLFHDSLMKLLKGLRV